MLQPGLKPDEWHAILTAMNHSLAHRGPDDAGLWYDAAAGVGLAHRRLSIVDLSPLGHQPMASSSGRYHLSYNGEVYNFAALRHELQQQGHHFRGTSDTEVILAAIEAWGITAAVRCCVGMFAFAVWDSTERVLHLVRDRLGIKPLYYGIAGGAFIFSSELKVLRTHPQVPCVVDRNALTLLLRHSYIPAPYAIYQGIAKLPPGTILSLRGDEYSNGSGSLPDPLPYWSARAAAEHGIQHPFCGTAEEAREHLDSLLRDAVGMRMVADVPLGAFLSGGVDSSTVVALMQAQSERPVRTFSIGFHEANYNEATYARAVAHHLGSDHTELYVSPEEAMAVIPRLPTLYDEPFADSSQIPTFLVAELARRHVTVSLSGDGGDEVFGGYNRYTAVGDLWRKVGWMSSPQRYAVARMLTAPSPERLTRTLGWLTPLLHRYGQFSSVGDRLQQAADALSVNSPERLYYQVISHWQAPATLVPGAYEPPTRLTTRNQWAALPHLSQQMMYLDSVTYLPDDILVKVDRASMGVSLEARVPLLDHRVVEFAWQLPLSMKLHQEGSKWLLRQVLYRYVPRNLIERPKTGFGMPIGAWLRGPMRDWAEALLDESRLRHEGFFDPVPIRQRWAAHLAGQRNWNISLWNVLMFQAWHEHWGA
jgi:asparagine synthase (glutamine-hydrolysing)